MHIPDGFLDPKTWITLDAVATGTVGLSVFKTSRKLREKAIPLMGVLAAFIFAAQMLNFPIAGGTSGHFVGGVLAAILLGPFAGTLVMTVVIIVQALLFQDGGITVLGANVFNMAIIGSLLGYYIFRVIKLPFKSDKGLYVSAFLTSWTTVVVSSSLVAIQLAVSRTVALAAALTAMAGIHAIIGIGEGLITVGIIALIKRVRPDLILMEKV
ncbi:MAG: energy-coupling factor ABC transporter permease [Actinobacteria bacterium]|nr:energy-coupling factor ABC transporter permease [Actinomycetota bacterium]